MAVVDPAVEEVLAATPHNDVEAWRVVQLRLVHLPRKDAGRFHSGDCYLVYHRTNNCIYFWLGNNSTVDERTAVAIKAVELDDYLGGYPVQCREVQGHESAPFLSLFPSGLVILAGGARSGLREVKEENDAPRLYRVVGKRNPVYTEVAVDWGNINHGDVFVLDTGRVIFVWVGRQASGVERLAGAGMAAGLRDNVGEEVIVVNDGEEGQDWAKWLPLEGRGEVGEARADGDGEVEETVARVVQLYRCSDQSGEMQVENIKTGKLSKDDLQSEDTFVVDGGELLGVWVWRGRRSSGEEKKCGMAVGEKFLEEKNYPSHTRLVRVAEGGESMEFKSLFSYWS